MKALELPPDSVLRAQAELVSGNLERCREMLGRSPVAGALPAEVRDPLGDQLERQRVELTQLAKRVKPDAVSDGRWRELELLSQAAESQLAETLGFLEGALIRNADLDHGICGVADALLNELSASTRIPWVELTILAGEESYAQRTGIIHLRFPEFTVWALPLAAHEFGHVVAQELRDMRPDGSFEYPIAKEIAMAGTAAAHQREIFADVFATYALGPAYACSAVLLRFSPARAAADDSGRQHPSDGKRVAAIVRTLRWMSKRQDAFVRPYDGIAGALEATWEAGIKAIGGEALEPERADEVAYWVEGVYLPRLDNRLEAARYGGWGAALSLGQQLGNAGQPAGQYAVADVLNAAWGVRLMKWQDEDAVGRLGKAALDLCLNNRLSVPQGTAG